MTQDIHCVTRWSRFDTTFEGVHWRELEKLVGQRASARYVVAHAEQGFTSNVPIASLEDERALLATRADGEQSPSWVGMQRACRWSSMATRALAGRRYAGRTWW